MIRYPLASSTWGVEEKEALLHVIADGKFTMGEKVEKFEIEFSKYVGSKYAVMVNSGSSANLAMLSAWKYSGTTREFTSESEIIVPAVSWSTTFYPINQIGCKIRFVDINLDTLNLDINKVAEAINENTVGIFAVNLLGNPANLRELQELCRINSIVLFEDNCESLGAELDQKKTGTFGLAGTYSTFFSHHISTMEGGLITTDSEILFQYLKSIRAHGWTRELPKSNFVHNKTGDPWEDSFRFVIPGYNLRPLELEGAVGSQQLLKLDTFIEKRRRNAKVFEAEISALESYKIQIENGKSSWFGFSIILMGKLSGKRRELVQLLAEKNIDSRPIVAGNFARNPVLSHLNSAEIPILKNADLLHENGLFFGNHHFDLNTEIDYLARTLREFEGRY